MESFHKLPVLLLLNISSTVRAFTGGKCGVQESCGNLTRSDRTLLI